MDVGLAMTARNHPDQMRPLTEIYREVLDEAVLGEHLTYAQAMGSLAAIVLLASSVVFALGPENKGISFSKEPV